MALTQSDVENSLKGWIDPNLGKDLVSAKMVKKIEVDGDKVSVRVRLGYPAASYQAELQATLIDKIKTDTGAADVAVEVGSEIVSHAVQKNLKPLPGVKNIIAVASGKGGVGKSTTAVNLALALASEGARVGILDADIYGPSQPTMLGISGQPKSRDGKSIEPMTNHGIQAMSIGFMLDTDE